jgi:hypothetical protein
VKVKSTFNSRVGFQLRDGAGKVLDTGLLTPDSVYASYPVIKGVDDHTVLVAYTQREGEVQQVRCVQMNK